MKKYHINVFFSDEDDCWVADIPDFKSCAAFGNTPAEAMREVLVAQEAWLETAIAHGDPIPEPRYVATPDAKSDLTTLTAILPSISSVVPVSDLKQSTIPDKPGVYFFFLEDTLIYIGEGVSLRKRIGFHIASTNDLSRSSLRRNVAEHLGITDIETAKQRPSVLTNKQIEPINKWIRRLNICWTLCSSKPDALLLEEELRHKFLPQMNKK
ncbi:MAG: GIY-YIG nuclease family protein [Phycisphaerales bacterium]